MTSSIVEYTHTPYRPYDGNLDMKLNPVEFVNFSYQNAVNAILHPYEKDPKFMAELHHRISAPGLKDKDKLNLYNIQFKEYLDKDPDKLIPMEKVIAELDADLYFKGWLASARITLKSYLFNHPNCINDSIQLQLATLVEAGEIFSYFDVTHIKPLDDLNTIIRKKVKLLTK